jgi:hypothetical protein
MPNLTGMLSTLRQKQKQKQSSSVYCYAGDDHMSFLSGDQVGI